MLVVSSIASLIGFGVAVLLSVLFEKVQEMRRENRDLCTEIQITREIKEKELGYLTVFLEETCLKEAAIEFRKGLEELEGLNKKDGLKPNQEIERRVLGELLCKILSSTFAIFEVGDE